MIYFQYKHRVVNRVMHKVLEEGFCDRGELDLVVGLIIKLDCIS